MYIHNDNTQNQNCGVKGLEAANQDLIKVTKVFEPTNDIVSLE